MKQELLDSLRRCAEQHIVKDLGDDMPIDPALVLALLDHVKELEESIASYQSWDGVPGAEPWSNRGSR